MAMFLTYFLITTFCTTVIWVQADKGELQTLRRQKREWFIPPKKLMENVDYTNQEFIMKIQWGEETRDNLTYSLIGSAVDEGLFTVNPKNGYVRIHGILDREKTATYEPFTSKVVQTVLAFATLLARQLILLNWKHPHLPSHRRT
ncbi:desmoglein-2-like protein [Neoarius graeffei]|uniref:desmoglein-2-like protein n=1 Tax=Neoarius graeffei TaxID=443677 RepID=UPI00298BEBA6|nr:desmoglein-2-like protein [Neoarius graeffei]